MQPLLEQSYYGPKKMDDAKVHDSLPSMQQWKYQESEARGLLEHLRHRRIMGKHTH